MWEGETLADRLTRERQLPEESLRRLLEEVLSGLEVMHAAGYVHRDIKPGNLMLREEDGECGGIGLRRRPPGGGTAFQGDYQHPDPGLCAP